LNMVNKVMESLVGKLLTALSVWIYMALMPFGMHQIYTFAIMKFPFHMLIITIVAMLVK
jgi:hypothetical protein